MKVKRGQFKGNKCIKKKYMVLSLTTSPIKLMVNPTIRKLSELLSPEVLREMLGWNNFSEAWMGLGSTKNNILDHTIWYN